MTDTISRVKKHIHAGHVEVEVARLIDYRKNIIVPNVSWGLGLNHECDLLVLDPDNRFTEIEIKVTKQDFLKDFKKWHGHKSKIITRLVYAMPWYLVQELHEQVPRHCGIISIEAKTENSRGLPLLHPSYKAVWHRRCKHSNQLERVSDHTIRNFMRLGCMRIWALKEHNNTNRNKL